MESLKNEISKGFLTENPLLKLALGLCPSLAISTTLQNGLCLGASAIFVLVGSNTIISLMRRMIPDRIRIPSYILIIATFVTIVQLVISAYMPLLTEEMGIYIPLLAVNCVILGRAEAFAAKNKTFDSLIDGLVMGTGFALSLCLISGIREILGSNKIWGIILVPEYKPMIIFLLAPGGFFVFALLMTLTNHLSAYWKKSHEKEWSK